MPFTGGLYAWRKEPAETVESWVARIDGLQIASSYQDGWYQLVWSSGQSLVEGDQLGDSSFPYEFLIRRGALNRFLLLSNHIDLTVALIEKASLTPRIYRPEINVHNLVNDLATQPGKYSMGTVWARIEGQGQALRTGGFFGVDLGESELFRRLLREMQSYRVTLRDVVSRSEVVSIGSRGEVGFDYSGPHTLLEVDTALHFLSSRAYLKWDVDHTRYSS
jgi:hypothetical protein